MSTSLAIIYSKLSSGDDLLRCWMELSSNQLPDDSRRLSEDHPDPGVHPSLVYDHQKARSDNLTAIFDFTNPSNKWFHLYNGQCHKIILNCSSSFSNFVKTTALVCRHFIRLSLQCSECVLISPDSQYQGYWRHSDIWMTRRVARARQ